MMRALPCSPLFPYTTLFRSLVACASRGFFFLPVHPWLSVVFLFFFLLLAACPTMQNLIPQDRKSTRLNSSHVKISYAVFCLKKKNHGIGHFRAARHRRFSLI